MEDCYDSDGVLKPFTGNMRKTISLVTKGNADVVNMGYLDGTVVEEAVKYGKKTIAVAMEGGMWYDNGEFNYSIVSLSILSSGKFTDVCKNAIRKAIKNYHEMAE